MTDLEYPELPAELRRRFREGASVVEVMRFMIDHVGMEPPSRIMVFLYFRIAFSAGLGEIMPLGAWNYFEGSTWDDEAINARMGPVLERGLERYAE